jgi:hypothetical protein
MNNQQQLNENLEQGDLKRLIHPELHIDEYKSKMGSDDSVCVLSFKVGGKEAATDLMSFIEKGYDWVLDADVSSGEKEGGDYLVFVETDRRSILPENIISMIDDIRNLTEQSIEDWHFRYHKSAVEHELTVENLTNTIPLSPEDYRARYEKEEKELDKLKAAAGLEINAKAPVNDYTESLRIAAGIK